MFACELWVERVGTFGVVLYRNQCPVHFNVHFGELHSDNSINDKNNLFEYYIPKCYKVKRTLITFNCFSEYINGPFSDDLRFLLHVIAVGVSRSNVHARLNFTRPCVSKQP